MVLTLYRLSLNIQTPTIFFLLDTSLQSIPFWALKPSWAPGQFFGVLFKISKDPDIVIHSECGPLLIPTIYCFQGWEGEPYMGKIRNTQREAFTGQGHPVPQCLTGPLRGAPFHRSILSLSTVHQMNPRMRTRWLWLWIVSYGYWDGGSHIEPYPATLFLYVFFCVFSDFLLVFFFNPIICFLTIELFFLCISYQVYHLQIFSLFL